MASNTKVSGAEETIKDIRRETRRKWIAEEKIRIVSQVGEIGGQRIAAPLVIERVHPQDGSVKELWGGVLLKTGRDLELDEIATADARVRICNLQEAADHLDRSQD